jgi:hypothetical protein
MNINDELEENPKLVMRIIWNNLTDTEISFNKSINIQSIISYGVIDMATEDEYLAKECLKYQQLINVLSNQTLTLKKE